MTRAVAQREGEPVRAVGVDACRSGWVAVVLDDGRLEAVCARGTLAEIVAACPGPR